MHGGKRSGAGRKSGSVSAAKKRLQQTVQDVSAQVLREVDAVAISKRLLLQQDKPQVVASTMEYLTDRVFGKPAQIIQAIRISPSRFTCRGVHLSRIGHGTTSSR